MFCRPGGSHETKGILRQARGCAASRWPCVSRGVDVDSRCRSGPCTQLWRRRNQLHRLGNRLPIGIASGPDGALWFTNATHFGSIGRISTSGVVSNFTGTGIETPLSITTGPDGALWFTMPSGSIGRMTTSGAVSVYQGTGSGPIGITAGPDGALWFTNSQSNSIGRITTAGVISTYAGAGIDYPDSIVTGSDGAMWFTNANNSSIGRITTAGVVTNYTGTGIDFPWGITAGPDGALWFANESNDSIGRITSVPVVSASPASGEPRQKVAVSGTGLLGGEQIYVTYNTGVGGSSAARIAICSAIAADDGTFNCLGRIPSSSIAGASGDYVIRATGTTSLATAKTIFVLT